MGPRLIRCQPSLHVTNLLPSSAFLPNPVMFSPCPRQGERRSWMKQLAELLDLEGSQGRVNTPRFFNFQGLLLVFHRAPIIWIPRMSYRSLSLDIIIRLLIDNSNTVFCGEIEFLRCFISQFSNPRSNLYLCSYTVQKPSFVPLCKPSTNS